MKYVKITLFDTYGSHAGRFPVGLGPLVLGCPKKEEKKGNKYFKKVYSKKQNNNKKNT